MLRALKKAIVSRKTEIIYNDQGVHFICGDYINLLKEHEIQMSMDGKGRAINNTITVKFLRNLKWEKIYYDFYHKPNEV